MSEKEEYAYCPECKEEYVLDELAVRIGKCPKGHTLKQLATRDKKKPAKKLEYVV